MTELKFGFFLIPNAADPLLETVLRVERLGLDYIGVQDHPYQRRYVDTWALMSMALAKTSRVAVFPDVTNLPLREPPSVMAKMAASLDVLSDGRFELGLGAGAFWDAIEAYGGPRRNPAESLAALEEAITVIRMIWSGERGLRFDGKFYRLGGSHSGPVPAHPIGIWLGAYGPRALELTGRLADGWIPSFQGDVGRIAAMSARLDDAIAKAGRQAGDVRRVLNVNGTITDGSSEGPLKGPVDQWTEELTRFAKEFGFDTFIFWGEGEDQLELFAGEVVPALREAASS